MKPDPNAPITTLKGVGPKLEQTLNKLGIYRLIDLLIHLPFRYQDRTQITTIASIQAGQSYLVEGEVTSVSVVYGQRRSLKVALTDATGRVYLRLFYFSKYQQKALEEASHVRAFGEFRFFGKELSVAHPEYESFANKPPPATPELTPIYPATQGLGQTRIRKLATQVCSLPWPADPGTPYESLLYLHQPPAEASEAEIESIQTTLAVDELTAYYLVMKGRALARQSTRAIGLPQSVGLGRKLLSQLGFQLTQAQRRVVAEVLHDLEQDIPMLRLVQGDVGSGKTIVAAFAAIRAAEQSCQCAVMAPTELLAEQHHLNFQSWLEPLGITTVLITGSLTAKEQRERLKSVADGDAQVVIGTHALFQSKVVFNNLALSIIDEQHRFGVHQRMALQHKGQTQPHQLIMTATPIPRTLTMALYADMQVSVIDELPKGRQPITTHTVEEKRRPDVVAQVEAALKQGQQAYWVCVLIEDSQEIDAMSAQTLFADLTAALPHRRISLLHGRMKGDEKVATMQAFKKGEIDALVATTVIEVGVDVPNATHMVIENAERLGLAQLHQLRGRVGRGEIASHCFLMFSRGLGEAAKTRLSAMRESQDGFYLAEQDLKLRGPGDLLGTRQSGEQSFRIADLALHAHLIPQAIARGDALLAEAENSSDPSMNNLLNMWAPTDSGSLTV
ncbi:MAG: ATP-dependent DNA helicase RecG [Candidatus Azotimanducaceae bacterium]